VKWRERRPSPQRAGVFVACVVGLVSTGLVASAAQAHGVTGDTDGKVSVPSSVVGSLDDATAAERARLVGNTIPTDANRLPNGQVAAPKVPVSAPRSAIPKAGAAFAAISGLSMGWAIGAAGAQLFGYDTTGTWQDVVGLAVVPAPTYDPNGDVVMTPVTGFVPGQQVTGDLYRAPTYASVGPHLHVPEITAHPGFGVSGSAGLRTVFAPFPSDAEWQRTGYVQWVVCRDADTGALSTLGTAGYSDFSKGGTVAAMSGAWTCAAPLVFDHALFAGTVSNGDTTIKAGTEVYYYPEGHASRPVEPDGNPSRRWELRYGCSEGVGGVAQSALFYEADAEWPAIPTASCAAGEVNSLELWQTSPDDPALDVLLDSWLPSQAVTDWRTAFPECQTAACTLELVRVDQGTDLSCFSDPAACVDWWTTAEPTRSERYECRYAGAVVALDECKVYSPTFNVATNTPVKTATGTVPATEVGRLADPKTGEPVPATGGNPAPEGDGQPDGCPPAFSLTSAFSGYWIYKGTLCALAAAFVPATGTAEAQMGRVNTAWGSSGVGEWSGALGGAAGELGDIGGSADGCSGPEFSIPLGGNTYEFRPLYACDGPMASVAPVVKLFISVMVCIGGLLMTARPIMAAMGYADALPPGGAK
jgi:hypothetical protein